MDTKIKDGKVVKKAAEKKKYLKLRPDEQSSWCIIAFDKECLWDGNISEMEEDDIMIVEVVEMTPKEVSELPEFQGW